MFSDIKSIVARSSGHLVEDAAGCLAILVLLMVALHLPGLA
jgi:hypothetical protein